MTKDTSLDQVRLAERIEAEFMFAYVDGISVQEKSRLGVTTRRLGGGVVLSVPHDPTGYWSKSLGFGVDGAVDATLIDEVVQVYRDEKVPGATIQIAPAFLPEDWPQIAAAAGLRAGGRIVKLAAEIESIDVPQPVTDLRIGTPSADELADWASVGLRAFGMPRDSGLVDLLASGAQNPAFHPYVAWDGDEIVAVAMVFVSGAVAGLTTGATLPSHRGRGAQSALIAARINAARDAGCRVITAETGKAPAGERNPSTENLIRSGLRPLYVRQDWTWAPAAADATAG